MNDTVVAPVFPAKHLDASAYRRAREKTGSVGPTKWNSAL